MIEIIKGTTKTPVSSQRLVELLGPAQNLKGQLYIGYPIFSTPEGRYPIDAILISPVNGVILFHIIEGTTLPDDYKEIQDDIYNKLEAKLRNHKSLMRGRILKVPINIITYAPAVKVVDSVDERYPICTDDTLIETIKEKNEKFDTYRQLLSVIQSISTIRKGIKKRTIVKADSRGAKLQKLEESIANLDNQQSKAVIETVDTVQRIRGLAGSGKTIVLALKAAYLHSQNPEWNLAVTFQTRSLKGQFRKLINTFTIEQTGEEPNWEKLRIIHAWGAPGGGEREGIYYNFCKTNEVEYFDYGGAKNKFGRGNEFGGACQQSLDSIKHTIEPMFDAILVDEAQDFPSSFLRICYIILGDKKRFVYAYDELQNLSSESLPSPEEIFGKDDNGSPLVKLENKSQDIILEKCYRNSKPLLTTAHSLGFGIYRKTNSKTGTGLIQMFENSQLWKDIGYSVVNGQLKDGKDVVLERTDRSSPKFLEEHSKIEDLIQFHAFNSVEEQETWLVKEIQKNLSEEDELRVDDIIVINPDPLKTKNAVGSIRANLFKKKINSHLAGVDTTPDIFFLPENNSVAFTGIYRAKGNEAGMVYIINSQDCYDSFGSLESVRNQLFTAITRSKAWVRVLGVGQNMELLQQEFEFVKNNNFQLKFMYPNERLRKKLNIVNRDMTEEEKRKVRKVDNSLGELVQNLDNGSVQLEDLDPKQIEILKKMLENKE
ncbi:MAG: ATP-binding domain-containing protein [Candidatus Cloacimonadota bacterium]|nr:ATP-binding domain-containing protein [Candidatus Cloacimonadota bacterium]